MSYSKENANEYDNFESPLFKTTWPKGLHERFFKNIESLSSYFNGKQKELNLLKHIEKLCKNIALGDIEAEKRIKEENDYLKKRLISRSWGLKKAELYLGIRACINTIQGILNKSLINNEDEKKNIICQIFTIENSIPGQFNFEDFSLDSYCHYGKDESILISNIRDAAYQKNLDVFRDKKVIGQETAQIIENNANFYPNF